MRHNGEEKKIIKNRTKVYKAAKKLNPSRFNKGIRNWEPTEAVALNLTTELEKGLNKNKIS